MRRGFAYCSANDDRPRRWSRSRRKSPRFPVIVRPTCRTRPRTLVRRYTPWASGASSFPRDAGKRVRSAPRSETSSCLTRLGSRELTAIFDLSSRCAIMSLALHRSHASTETAAKIARVPQVRNAVEAPTANGTDQSVDGRLHTNSLEWLNRHLSSRVPHTRTGYFLSGLASRIPFPCR
jgi:hypothetical protein